MATAAAANSDSVWPHRWQSTRFPHPWVSPGKNTGVGCHFLLGCMKVKSESEVGQSCPTLSDSLDCSLPGSSVHGVFQARQLEWAAISFSRGSSQPRDWTQVSRLEGRCFIIWATRESLGRRTKETLNDSERWEWKVGLHLNIHKTKIIASGPITSWQIDGKKMETVTDFIFLGFKLLQMVTAAMKLKDDCSLEEKL